MVLSNVSIPRSALWTEEDNFIMILVTGSLCLLVCFFGLIANGINIIIFTKHGFTDAINVLLVGLSVGDFMSLFTLFGFNVLNMINLYPGDFPFNPSEISAYGAGWPHIMFTRVVTWITAFITLERALCVITPFKVKSILTPKRNSIIIVLIYMISIASYSPVYFAYTWVWTFIPWRNISIWQLRSEGEGLKMIEFMNIQNAITPAIGFFVLVVFTIALVFKLNQKSNALNKISSGPQQMDMIQKDKRIAKMVSIISIVFICCYLPGTVVFAVMLTVEEFYVGGQFIWLTIVLYAIIYFMEAVSSSVNIFIFMTMSSKFKNTFSEMFGGFGNRPGRLQDKKFDI